MSTAVPRRGQVWEHRKTGRRVVITGSNTDRITLRRRAWVAPHVPGGKIGATARDMYVSTLHKSYVLTGWRVADR